MLRAVWMDGFVHIFFQLHCFLLTQVPNMMFACSSFKKEEQEQRDQ
jgi:hypothetical protein